MSKGGGSVFDSKQISIYFLKFLRLLMDKKSLFFMLEAVMIPLIVSLVLVPSEVFYGYRATRIASFTLISASVWIGLFNSVTNICGERKIIKFEHCMKGLSLSSYMLARLLADMFLCIIETILMMIVITNVYTRLQGNIGQVILLSITVFIVIFTADMLALLISAAVKKSSQAMTIIPMVLIIQLIFSSFIEALEGKAPFANLLSNITLTKWGTTAFFRISNQINLIPNKGGIDWQTFQMDGAESFSFDMIQIIGNWLILIIFAAIYFVSATKILKSIQKDSR